MINPLAEPLQKFLRDQSKADVTVQTLKPLPGGASRESWVVLGLWDGSGFQMVLRRDLVSEMIENALTREQEFAILQAAYQAGVKVPQPRYYSADPAVLERPFLLMDFVNGISIGPKVVRDPKLADARTVLPAQLAEQLAKIHKVDLSNPTLAFLKKPTADTTPAQIALDDLQQMADKLGVKNPAITFAMRWARENAPTPLPLSLVHGDFRVGNLLIVADGLSAIIDWEFCHVGDPREDLAWICLRDWRFGKTDLRLGGFSEREPFIAAYEQHSGQTIDRKAVDYWEILGNLRWCVTCHAQADRHLSGQDPSIEFASLGRRAIEMQAEFLRLISEWKD